MPILRGSGRVSINHVDQRLPDGINGSIRFEVKIETEGTTTVAVIDGFISTHANKTKPIVYKVVKIEGT